MNFIGGGQTGIGRGTDWIDDKPAPLPRPYDIDGDDPII